MVSALSESLNRRSGLSDCRCARALMQSLLSPIAHALSMLVIAMAALLLAGDLVARLENFGSRGRNNSLRFALDVLLSRNHSADKRLSLLRDWSMRNRWNIEEGLLYTFSLFSTIGFGKYAPVTPAGRCVSAIFIVLIVPIGVLYVQTLATIYQSMLSRLLIAWRRQLDNCCGRIARLIFPNGDETIVVIPMTLLTLVLHFHLLVAVGFLCFMERWTSMQSLYYLISATTTIGFGDFHTGPHSLSYAMATVTFQLHLCALFMLVINYLNDALEWILQSGNSRTATGRLGERQTKSR